MIEECFVSLETARLLKEAGFDVLCYVQYSERGIQLKAPCPENFNAGDWGYSCPTLALAARWLRETHNIHVFPFFEYARKKWCYGVSDTTAFCAEEGMYMPDECFLSCEEAFEAGLQYGLKLIKK